MSEEQRANKKQIDQLIEHLRELNRKIKSDMEKLAEIQRDLRTLSDHDISAVELARHIRAEDSPNLKNG
jgi:hypothetical protein